MRSLGSSRRCVALLLIGWALAPCAAAAPVSSYATSAQDDPGSSTGAAAVALGVPDYEFANDFGVGESTVLAFPQPILAIADQPDLLISAFVGGAGATDDAQVEVEVSSDGTSFTSVGTFSTSQGRDPLYYAFAENGFESVKHFPIEIGSVDPVTHVRLRNTAGTAEGLQLDAIEALHPERDSDYAFEIRLEEYRDPLSVGRFLVRLKNTARAGGQPIHELRIVKAPDPVRLEDTDNSHLYAQFGEPGEFLCVEACIPDNSQLFVPFSRHAWSLDGLAEAPLEAGLDPGRQAAHRRSENFDTDPFFQQPPPDPPPPVFAGFSFVVTFADGTEQSLDFDTDVLAGGALGALYQKYQYFSATPANNGPQRAYFAEYLPEPVTGLSAPLAVGLLLLRRSRTRSARHRPKQSSTFPA